MMHGFGFGTFGWIGMILNLVITIGVIVGIVVLVVWMVRRFGTESSGRYVAQYGSGSQQTPREIVQSRYARGEISREEYQQLLKDIS
ncbi:MAG: SHOCT domain-containing protein [Anaerolineales bacterium]|jgi:putative membrane protein